MKFLIIFVAFIASTLAQRGTYSGSRVHGVPDVAYRFRNNNVNTGVNSNQPINPNINSNIPVGTNINRNPLDNTISGSNLGNRWNDDNFENRFSKVDYNNIYDKWPRENLPFNVVNADAINRHMGMTPRPSNVNIGNVRPSNGAGFQNRFDSGSLAPGNSFDFNRNGQRVTYEYDPQRDAWYPRRF